MTEEEKQTAMLEEQKNFTERFDALMEEAKKLGELEGFWFKPDAEMTRKCNILKELSQREVSYQGLLKMGNLPLTN